MKAKWQKICYGIFIALLFIPLYQTSPDRMNKDFSLMRTPIAAGVDDFISVWNTSLISTGSSGIKQVTLPLVSNGTYDFFVEWGDGYSNTITSYDHVNVTHAYDFEGVYTINITGIINGWQFNDAGDKLKLIEIQQWGCLQLENSGSYFYGCENLNLTATDDLNLTGTTTLYNAFRECANLGSTGNMNGWNVSGVTNMERTFWDATSFDQLISNWDVSHVTVFTYMFHGASAFNQPLNNWNVSSATHMTGMFEIAASFNHPLNSWNVSNVNYMNYMFRRAYEFNQPLNNWDVSNVYFMSAMFGFTTTFNQPIGNWNFSSFASLGGIFYGATAFNQSVNDWDVSSMTNMDYMFSGASSFNQALDKWDVSGVTSMEDMFKDAPFFNQPLDNWDVSQVSSMIRMFSGVSAFNQPLDGWDVSQVTHLTGMFTGTSAFNQPLDNWDVSSVIFMGSMFEGATSFDQPISNWNLSSVVGMEGMFEGATSFNQPINNWNVSHISSMNSMFRGASSFNQPLNSWDVSNVRFMYNTFQGASSFNQPIGNWKTSKVTTMANMFEDASAFNQSVNAWNVSSVTSFSYMFWDASDFNQPLNNWDTSSVTIMFGVFYGASSFNQHIGNWNVSSVTRMDNMFKEAVSFDQSIGIWNVSNVTNMAAMFQGMSLSTENYDDLLNGWSSLTLQSGVTFHGGSSKYGFNAISSRQSIIDTFSWIITDGGFDENSYPPSVFDLSSDADTPDSDGSFTLTWTSSTNATHYSVYHYSSYITEINGSLTILLDQTTDLTLPLSEYSGGTYYFIVVASNDYDDTLSPCIGITISIPDSLTITNPIASSSWEIETYQYINWTSTGSITDVKLELFYDDVFILDITLSTFNDGEYYWLIPNDLSDGDLYRIKISDSSNSSVYDYSEYFDVVLHPALRIENPRDGFIWETGTSYDITWTSTGIISSVNLELYKNGEYVQTIISGTENDGTYTWMIPSSLEDSRQYQIKIVDASNDTVYDFSGEFQIHPPLPDNKIPGYNIFLFMSGIAISVFIVIRKWRFNKK
ncbi:MAG: BspA family leucine-rich repeat surface protein [Promethearchaeota archaeon]